MSSSSLISLSAIALGLFAFGCSGTDGKISLDTSSGAKLSDAPNDALFVVKLEEADDDGYALDTVRVKITLTDGAEPVDASCTALDANTNGKLEEGESLSCTEGATNVFGKDLIGKTAKVALTAKIDGEEGVVGEAEWKP